MKHLHEWNEKKETKVNAIAHLKFRKWKTTAAAAADNSNQSCFCQHAVTRVQSNKKIGNYFLVAMNKKIDARFSVKTQMKDTFGAKCREAKQTKTRTSNEFIV